MPLIFRSSRRIRGFGELLLPPACASHIYWRTLTAAPLEFRLCTVSWAICMSSRDDFDDPQDIVDDRSFKFGNGRAANETV